MRNVTITCACLLALLPRTSLAQSNDSRVEVGAQVGWIDLIASVNEKPVSLGLRVGYRVNTIFGVEGELTTCPANAGSFGQVLVVAGVKAGPHIGPLSVLGKVRVGAIQFNSKSFRALNGGTRTEPAIDIGAVIELRLSTRVALRVDTGRTIVLFGSKPVVNRIRPPDVRQLGATLSPQGALGLQVSF